MRDMGVCVVDTTSDNASTTQFGGLISYVVDTRKRTCDNGGYTRASLLPSGHAASPPVPPASVSSVAALAEPAELALQRRRAMPKGAGYRGGRPSVSGWAWR